MACSYFQNSGLGNTINPIVSLASKDVYSIPLLLIIGWRGELLTKNNQLKDEPQHIQQGRITLEQLKVLEIPFCVLDEKSDDWESNIWNFDIVVGDIYVKDIYLFICNYY